MKSNLIRAGGFSFALVLLLGSVPAPIQAATSSSSGSSSSFTEVLARTSSRSSSYGGYGRVPSGISRKIKELDDDEVEKLPVPILTGVALRNLTKNFGDPRDGGARMHEGLDIMAAKDSFIVSPTDAVVIKVGDGDSSGNYVSTANPGGETFIYMHLDKFAKSLSAGDVLKPGDLIGYVGNTGNAAGGATHLHLEIRDGRKATDPYPRLTREFTTEERGEALAKIIDDASKSDAEDIITANRAILIAARAAGVKFPKDIDEAIGATVAGSTVLAGSSSFARDLTLGSQGSDVAALQSFLIAQDSGAAADALLAAGATGYFGPVTQRALAEYQAKAGISPATGYFGPLTRARVLSVI